MSIEAENPALPRGGSGEMFDRIASRYDLLNRLISLGIDQRWRRRTVSSLELSAGKRVLDLATGTADLAIMVANTEPGATVVGLDPSIEMMRVGKRKLVARALTDRVSLVTGDAQALPFEAGSFDGLCMAFGIRNVPDRELALREMVRVCRPGAKVAVLELSEPKSGIISGMARFHMHRVVPWLGGWLSGSREYRYLPQSIAEFPPAQVFADLMRNAGLKNVVAHSLSFGVCHLYVGERP